MTNSTKSILQSAIDQKVIDDLKEQLMNDIHNKTASMANKPYDWSSIQWDDSISKITTWPPVQQTTTPWPPLHQTTTTTPTIPWQYPYYGQPSDDYESQNMARRMASLERTVKEAVEKMKEAQCELARKNAFIEKFATSMALILMDPEKLAKLEGMKDLYEQYIMLGKMIHGPEFDKLLAGLR